jgi:hypothetical protein
MDSVRSPIRHEPPDDCPCGRPGPETATVEREHAELANDVRSKNKILLRRKPALLSARQVKHNLAPTKKHLQINEDARGGL